MGRGVLIVEEWAHRPLGHYPNRFMEVAEGFASAGYRVETLTSCGWHQESPDRRPTVPVRRYGRVAFLLLQITNRLHPSNDKTRTAVGLLRAALLVRQVRRATKRMGDPNADVVVVGAAAPPEILPLFVRSGVWITHVFLPEPRCGPRISAALLRRAAQSQRSCAFTIAVPTAEWADAYRRTGATVVCIPLAGIRNTTPITDAAKQLGIPPARRIALLFGAGHGDKDGETVAASFRTLDDWQLLIVGRAASSSEINSAHWRVPPVVISGFVDGETRSLAFEAADVVVLSFVAGYRRNSGTFMDAMAHGVPVVVSEDSIAADLTERYGVGVTFIAGDSDSLQQALGRVPANIDPAALAAIRAEWSNDAVVRAHLAVLGHA